MSLEPLGAMIRRRRLDRNLSQEQLAQLSGLSRRHLLLIEGDKSNVSIEALARITKALGLAEVYAEELTIRPTPPDLGVIVEAGSVVDRLRRTLAEVTRDLDRVQAQLDALIPRYAAPAAVGDEVVRAARKLESSGAAEVGESLREIAASRKLPGAPRVEPEVRATARRRAR